MNQHSLKQNYKLAQKISVTTMIINILLTVLKVIIGFLANSTAIIADGIHSLSDVFTTIGVIIGLKFSSKEADQQHPYGHERIESITSLLLGLVLLLIGLSIGFAGIKNIYLGNYVVPKTYGIIAAVVSIIVKEWMYRYTMKYAISLKSPSLKADAWHHRSDSLSSIGVLIGVIGAILGFPILDSVVTIIICIIIVQVAYTIIKESVTQLIDHSADDIIINEIKQKIYSMDKVKHLDNLKTRIYGNKIYVDLEVSVDSNLTVEEGHNIAAKIHSMVEENSDVKHCMVHINPWKTS